MSGTLPIEVLSAKQPEAISSAHCQFSTFEEFDAAYGFSIKAGFKLTELQIKDAEQFVKWSASLNLYEVGGGKTVVSTVVSLMRGSAVTVVTVPPILLTPWVAWLEKVSERVLRYQGTPTVRAGFDLTTPRWIVVSHAILRQDFARLAQAVHKRGLIEVIVDEAHTIKNPASILFKKVQSMSSGNSIQMLTGTPVSKPLDAYSYIKIKTPKAYRSYSHFEMIHVAERDFFKKPTAYGNLDTLRENLAIQSISRTKKELHGYDLTPIFPDSSYDLSPQHMRLYRKLVEEQLLLFDDGSKIDATSAASLRHALQQVVVNLAYFSGNPEDRSVSFDLIDQTIEETQCAEEGHSKLIIWCKYKRTTATVLAYCNSLGIPTVAAYSGADTEKSIKAFMEDPSCRILAANAQSAGAGLNPQHVCSEALFLELETVPLLTRQCFGRLDRVGQTTVPRMRIGVARGTVQVGLLHDLLKNDDLVARIEPSKENIRSMLLGEI